MNNKTNQFRRGRRRTLLLSGVVVIILGVTGAGVANATASAPATPAQPQIIAQNLNPQIDACQHVSGQTARSCLHFGKRAAGSPAAASPNVITPPAQCNFDNWTGMNNPDRFTSCSDWEWILSSYTVDSSGNVTVKGQFEWIDEQWTTYSGSNNPLWDHGLELDGEAGWGNLINGFTAYVKSNCDAVPVICWVATSDVPETQLVTVSPNSSFFNHWEEMDNGAAYGNSGLYDVLDTGLGIDIDGQPSAAGGAWTALDMDDGLAGRCDSIITYFGCVNQHFTPTMTYNSTTNPKVAPVAQHVYDAQHGLLARPWGVPPSVLANGAPLTRDMNPADMTANNNAACPNGAVPAGLTCDEYPLASTHQGAAFNPDFNIRGVLPEANNSQGGITSQFYRLNRVIESDPFYVNAILSTGVSSW